jgi:hypothetical protein
LKTVSLIPPPIINNNIIFENRMELFSEETILLKRNGFVLSKNTILKNDRYTKGVFDRDQKNNIFEEKEIETPLTKTLSKNHKTTLFNKYYGALNFRKVLDHQIFGVSQPPTSSIKAMLNFVKGSIFYYIKVVQFGLI